MKYVDIHSHLNFPGYAGDLDEVIGRMRAAETGTIVVGTDYESSRKAVEHASRHPNIWACIGVHPADDPEATFDADAFELLASNPKTVAVGECGFDFYHRKKEEDYERQKALFLAQIEFAIAHNGPLMIHSRSGEAEVLEVLKPLKEKYGDKLRGDVHFFAGSLETAKGFWNIGFTTSFTGVITFARDYDPIIKAAPLDMLMSETDAPFVSPEPYRGKRNEPAYVVEVVKKIAEIRGEPFEVVQKAMVENATRIFGVGE